MAFFDPVTIPSQRFKGVSFTVVAATGPLLWDVEASGMKGEAIYALLRSCLRGWTDAVLISGEKDSEYSPDKVEMLETFMADEAVAEIMKISRMTEGDRKNYLSQLESSATGDTSTAATASVPTAA